MLHATCSKPPTLEVLAAVASEPPVPVASEAPDSPEVIFQTQLKHDCAVGARFGLTGFCGKVDAILARGMEWLEQENLDELHEALQNVWGTEMLERLPNLGFHELVEYGAFKKFTKGKHVGASWLDASARADFSSYVGVCKQHACWRWLVAWHSAFRNALANMSMGDVMPYVADDGSLPSWLSCRPLDIKQTQGEIEAMAEALMIFNEAPMQPEESAPMQPEDAALVQVHPRGKKRPASELAYKTMWEIKKMLDSGKSLKGNTLSAQKVAELRGRLNLAQIAQNIIVAPITEHVTLEAQNIQRTMVELATGKYNLPAGASADDLVRANMLAIRTMQNTNSAVREMQKDEKVAAKAAEKAAKKARKSSGSRAPLAEVVANEDGAEIPAEVVANEGDAEIPAEVAADEGGAEIPAPKAAAKPRQKRGSKKEDNV